MKISIITPVKNKARYIEDCILSVLRQDMVLYEHIFVDGVSTDGTLGIIQKYQREYPDKIRCISEPDKSAGDAWVKGMRIVRGDILSWLGADDTLEPGTIKIVQEWFASNPNGKFVFGGCNYISSTSDFIKVVHPPEFDLKRAVNNYCSIPCTSAFYRREVLETVNPDVIAQNDGELEWWLMVAEKYKLHRIESVLSNFRVYPDKARNDGFYEFANTVYQINRRHGMSPISKCALRYYAAFLSRPFSPILNPIFRLMTQGN